MMKKKVLLVFGTRPEAIKMAPVAKAIMKASDRFKLVICVTGQHREILDQMLNFFKVTPDIDLELMEPNQTLASLTSKAIRETFVMMEKVRPDVTLVQGDTTTAMCAGLASFYSKVPVGHVEAGLRTNDRYDPFPEEMNRRLLSQLTTLHFAPTKNAAKGLIGEGFAENSVFVTGNTVIDALLWTASNVEADLEGLGLKTPRYILVTAHRRENFGQPIRDICLALKEIVAKFDVDIVYPVHPNPNIKNCVYSMLGKEERIHLIAPLEYRQFVAYMKRSLFILTDSGGVQEEAPSLGKPVLILRKTTERQEAVDAGVAKLVGTDPNTVVSNVETLLYCTKTYEKMAQAANPFGDGFASERIVEILSSQL